MIKFITIINRILMFMCTEFFVLDVELFYDPVAVHCRDIDLNLHDFVWAL